MILIAIAMQNYRGQSILAMIDDAKRKKWGVKRFDGSACHND